MISFKVIGQGALWGEFQDQNGRVCSIQESSLATEPAIWLGHSPTEPGKGHRMLLTQERARELVPILRFFARTGYLGQEAVEESFAIGTWVVGVGENNHNIVGRVIELHFSHSVTVQDNNRSGPEGRITCTWQHADLIWAPIEPPAQIETPNRYQLLDEEIP